ncbi:cellulose binding domain-containing protein [Teredinibacter franksiae]|uniref:cellulose binding domain-containing protein n=1 Tax=Teredinibacter franksiae TaxID=2761453 RepID=UPI002483C627|nr:cellulose binding domain-containing protein [Teredinibacter franksiae]
MLNKNVKRFRLSYLLGLYLFVCNGLALAECEYVVTNSWGAGFTAAIRITNSSSSSINGWLAG